ncbi:hypothetical protein PPERSA_10734 [Pseudocohnilembus persalinus]|uniref:Uncharacterized protein n=1 Tax=Pseudocohnilembus persalinus TaxID=266149 RepID=A0A0V0QDH0_PSEPJ|nr:hypothetical protein PPERSA_10734 [Pseudocohnilembus persalinus]|eukprot:KRX00235.1 hypothetical protein PPERSA_10734 [Pseudocohnilembus persalinus]
MQYKDVKLTFDQFQDLLKMIKKSQSFLNLQTEKSFYSQNQESQPIQISIHMQKKHIEPINIDENELKRSQNFQQNLQNQKCRQCRIKIRGIIFNCTLCDNYFLCEICESKSDHPHPFIKHKLNYLPNIIESEEEEDHEDIDEKQNNCQQQKNYSIQLKTDQLQTQDLIDNKKEKTNQIIQNSYSLLYIISLSAILRLKHRIPLEL